MTRHNILPIASVDSDNYIGRFIDHTLLRLSDSDNFHRVTDLSAQLPEAAAVVWNSISPTPKRANEIAQVFSRHKPSRLIMLSSCSVYDADSGRNINELNHTVPDCDIANAEKVIESFCHDNGISLTVLRLPLLIVGTGMTGRLMEMVNQIYRGSYFHIKDSDTSVSVIHASSIADAVALCIKNQISGTFNLNDGTETTVHDLAEALSYRIGNKSIFTVKDSWARHARKPGDLLGISAWNSDSYRFKTTTLTFSSEKFFSATGFNTTPAVLYLKNHDYDENSL